MTLYDVGLWVVLIGGIAPSAYFVWTYRPRHRFSLDAFDACGWVAIILALYLTTTVRVLLDHRRPQPTAAAAATSLVLGALIDVVLWVRVLNWRRIQRHVDRFAPRRRSTDPPPGS